MLDLLAVVPKLTRPACCYCRSTGQTDGRMDTRPFYMTLTAYYNAQTSTYRTLLTQFIHNRAFSAASEEACTTALLPAILTYCIHYCSTDWPTDWPTVLPGTVQELTKKSVPGIGTRAATAAATADTAATFKIRDRNSLAYNINDGPSYYSLASSAKFTPSARHDKTVLSVSCQAVWIESRDRLAKSEQSADRSTSSRGV